ncbi:hypothetical protein [Halobaculum sp. D14]|uniref:hypothetical protein n=1 Tax=Halobaculum sp. D14 TaxID=3421642 RepID=UPI003EBAAB73
MIHDVAPGLLVGALALGAVHGAEPGHGWPVAAAYAFDRTNSWLSGLAAGLVIGVGHLVSSLAVVGVFFLLKTQIPMDGLSDPLHVLGVAIGSPIGVFAGVLLVLLGVREYRGGGHSHGHDDQHSHGHSHGHGDGQNHSHGDASADEQPADGPGRLHRDVDVAHSHSHDGHGDGGHGDDSGHHTHDHDDHGHTHDDHSHHDHSHGDGGVFGRLTAALPFVGGDESDSSHGHDHDALSADDGLYGIAVSAFVLGFAHEEEFEIIAICAGSQHCLGLMLAYAGTVVGVITALTLLLVAGYTRFEDRMDRYSEHFPTVSAVVLVAMGVGFLLGVL